MIYRGSFLADTSREKDLLDLDLEPISKLCGVPKSSFSEFCTNNITAFNTIANNKQNVKVILIFF